VLSKRLFCCLKGEYLPLLSKKLEDGSDIQQLDSLLRKNTITSILHGIQQAVITSNAFICNTSRFMVWKIKIQEEIV
jgi:hypothetical protein